MRLDRAERVFWAEAARLSGSALPLVLPRALLFGLFAAVVTAVDRSAALPALGIEVTPFEVAGGALGVLLVFRTNAGHERWWEGRRLWGGIVNQSRNLAIAALNLGPDDPAWRDRIIRRTIAFAQATRRGLRGEDPGEELAALLGPDDAARVLVAAQRPTAVAALIAESIREARERLGLDGFATLRIDRERAALVDHLGGCERIRSTPPPLAYRIEIRRFLVLFLASLPFAMVDRVGWLAPFVTVLVALPLLAIDKIGAELQDPFAADGLNPLPLDDYCATIARDLRDLLRLRAGSSHS